MPSAAVMILKIASLLQIALVLGCPCWCKAGLCDGIADCCGTEVASKGACSGASPSCCAAKAQRQSSAPCRDLPAPAVPNPSECQCLCGGAVPGESAAIEHSDELAAYPVVVAAAALTPGDHAATNRATPDRSAIGACSGRELRCLIASFLC